MTHPPAMGGGVGAPPLVIPIVRPPIPLTTTTPPPDPLPNERFDTIIVPPPIVIIPPPPPPLGGVIWLITTTTTTTTTPFPQCPTSISKVFLERHWWDECPISTCGNPGVPGSCSLATIGPINIYSDIFNNSCLKVIDPIVASVSYTFDNFGYVEGKNGSFGCPADNDCNICAGSATIIPFIESVNSDQSRAYIIGFAQNAFHGGPYSLAANITFNFS
jgi:hypothetical protein